MNLINKCPLTQKKDCSICNTKYLGWRHADDPKEDARLWDKFCKEQQEEHEKNWNAGLERITYECK